jgi:4-amino-4-deoxy-L-arabinose transferase-like glycosyltransferase
MRTENGGVSWPTLILLLLSPIWCLAIFARGAWTPDEPREYDITVNMLHDGDYAIPHLAGEPFLEKPPLLYWAGTTLMRVTGVSITAARAQNLVWCLIVCLSVGALVGSMLPETYSRRERTVASLASALCAGTMVLPFQVAIWYATDAPLLAATALAWLSAWSVAHTAGLRERLEWYLVFAAALTMAFFAKNLFGWVTPGAGLIAWLLWDRRWRILKERDLYVALLIVAALVALWIWNVAQRDAGAHDLIVLLRDNTLGRFTSDTSASGYEFGHRSHPLKFLALLPVFALPWTCCVVAALRWSWRELRQRSAHTSAIRFCLCAFAAGVVTLMLSATARDTYFAPSMLALCPLVGLWAVHAQALTADRGLLRIHRVLLLTASAVLVAVGLLIAYSEPSAWTLQRIVIALVALGVCGVGWWMTRSYFEGMPAFVHVPTWLAALLLVEVLAFPVLDASQNLPALADDIRADIGATPTVMYCADETTRAMLDATANLRLTNVCGDTQVQALLGRNPDQRFLVQTGVVRLSSRAETMLNFLKIASRVHQRDRHAPSVALESLGLRPQVEWSTPGGRSYGLYSQPLKQAREPVAATATESASSH